MNTSNTVITLDLTDTQYSGLSRQAEVILCPRDEANLPQSGVYIPHRNYATVISKKGAGKWINTMKT